MGKPIVDVVVSVPAFYSAQQRKAIRESAELADLNVISLIAEPLAAGVQYALNSKVNFDDNMDENVDTSDDADDDEDEKKKEGKSRYVVLGDIGAGSADFSLMRFARSGYGRVSVERVFSHGSPHLGSQKADVQLAKLLADRFLAEHEGLSHPFESDSRAALRARARLIKVARKTKEMLSANNAAPVSVEGLMNDIDFKTSVTREELEDLLTDERYAVAEVAQSFREQIKDVYGVCVTDDAEVGVDGCEAIVVSVELIGGATRIPAFRASISEGLMRNDLGRRLNGDEAIVLGAAYHGAVLDPRFRVKKYDILDLLPVDTSVVMYGGSSVEADDGEDEEVSDEADSVVDDGRVAADGRRRAVLVAGGDRLPARKSLKLKRTGEDMIDDFVLDFVSEVEGEDGNVVVETLASYNVTELDRVMPALRTRLAKIKKAQRKAVESGIIDAPEGGLDGDEDDDNSSNVSLPDKMIVKVKVAVDLDGVPKITDIDAAIRMPSYDHAKWVIRQAEKAMKGEDDDEEEEEDDYDDDIDSDSKGKKKKSKKKKEDKEPKEYDVKTIKLVLQRLDVEGSSEHGEEGVVVVSSARTSMAAWAKIENDRILRENALNELESLVYRIKNVMDDDELVTTYISEEENSELDEQVSDAFDFVEDAVMSELKMEDIVNKTNKLLSIFEPVALRMAEDQGRDSMLERVEHMLSEAERQLETWKLEREQDLHLYEQQKQAFDEEKNARMEARLAALEEEEDVDKTADETATEAGDVDETEDLEGDGADEQETTDAQEAEDVDDDDDDDDDEYDDSDYVSFEDGDDEDAEDDAPVFEVDEKEYEMDLEDEVEEVKNMTIINFKKLLQEEEFTIGRKSFKVSANGNLKLGEDDAVDEETVDTDQKDAEQEDADQQNGDQEQATEDGKGEDASDDEAKGGEADGEDFVAIGTDLDEMVAAEKHVRHPLKELRKLQRMVVLLRKWLADKKEAQEQLTKRDNPVLLSNDIFENGRAVAATVKRLMARRRLSFKEHQLELRRQQRMYAKRFGGGSKFDDDAEYEGTFDSGGGRCVLGLTSGNAGQDPTCKGGDGA